jgi:hypothetical protein
MLATSADRGAVRDLSLLDWYRKQQKTQKDP